MSGSRTIRLATAQTVLRDDPGRADELRDSGRDIRRLMRQARDEGAHLVHFAEGATCAPSKFALSVNGPKTVGASDWDRFEWDVLRDELVAIRQLAGQLGLWTVVGSVHRLTPPNRPYNSLYVISAQGAIVTRYDERLLSNTKVSYMYSPGRAPVTFEVEGMRFGCAIGMEAHFPEIFGEYERLDVDCVLFSSTGDGPPGGSPVFAAEVQGHAATNSYWVSFAIGAEQATMAPGGIVAPGGQWVTRASSDGSPSVVVAELDETAADVAGAVRYARPWRRTVRSGEVYAAHLVNDDPRSTHRDGL
jgi:predicted amidohydrolase